MTLEITLLKVWKEGETEAKKLLPYINNCDVYGAENAMCTEEGAARFDSDWAWALKNSSRTAMRDVMSRLFDKYFLKQSPHIKRYGVKQFDYLFVANRLIWTLERFTPEEAEKLKTMTRESDENLSLANKLFWQGNPDFLNFLLRGLESREHGIELRDRNMGKNISEAEERIRKAYPELCDKEPLRFTCTVGGLHQPEKYTQIPIGIQKLYTKSDYMMQLSLLYREDKTSEELKRKILLFAVKDLIERGHLKIDPNSVEQMKFEDLADIIKSLPRNGKGMIQNVRETNPRTTIFGDLLK